MQSRESYQSLADASTIAEACQ
ncbi:hypothetical protein TNCT_692921, partial [Trichonephila clavata]